MNNLDISNHWYCFVSLIVVLIISAECSFIWIIHPEILMWMLLHLCMIHCAFWYDYVTSHVNSLQLIIQIFANVCAPFFLHSTYMYYIFIYVVYLCVCVCVCVCQFLISINIILVTNFIMHSSMVFIRIWRRIHAYTSGSLYIWMCVYMHYMCAYTYYLYSEYQSVLKFEAKYCMFFISFPLNINK